MTTTPKTTRSRRTARNSTLPPAIVGLFLLSVTIAVAGSGPSPAGTPPSGSEDDPALEGLDNGNEIEMSATGVRKFRKELERPISLGVSGGNATDVHPADDPGFVVCSSGTLGGLVLKNGIPHILSNNHVIAIENGASIGDPIDQPGLIDNRCRNDPENYVAHLTGYKRIKFGGSKKNLVDAAIAEVVPGAVDPRGTIQKIGVPGDAIVAPEIGMPVKKAGRSTGLTRGVIEAIGVTFIVEFGDEDDPKTARFVRQILVRPKKRTFVESGDSGAVVLVDRKECPQWVGLLFAGSDDGYGGVNPITKVFRTMKRLKPRGTVTPIGCDSSTVDAAGVLVANLTAMGSPDASSDESAKLERHLRRGQRILEKREDEILEIDGVVGVGVGLLDGFSDRVALHILVRDRRPDTLAAIPAEIDGIPTRVVETGRFRAM